MSRQLPNSMCILPVACHGRSGRAWELFCLSRAVAVLGERSARRVLRPRRAGGFTLIELLVVVAIIAILGGLITAAATSALTSANTARMRAELHQLEMALQAYQEKFGDYPPDSSDPAAIKAHLAKAFPRFRGELPTQYRNLDPSTALVFWLGGMPDGDGVLNGFSADPTDPFGNSTSRIGPFHEFNRDRLKGEKGVYRYLPPNGNAQSEPYVYFRARAASPAYAGAYGNCKPCLDTRAGPTAFAAAKSYQLRSPGLDGKYGQGVSFPDGSDYDKFQYDDQGNFADRTFGDKIP